MKKLFAVLPIAFLGASAILTMTEPIYPTGRFMFRPGKDYALFFAVNDYQHPDLGDLKNPVNDANQIALELKNRYGFTCEVVANPKLSDIDRKLNEYRTKYTKGELDPEGQLFVYFSGHGFREDENGYFMPADAEPGSLYRTAFAYSIWRPFLDKINCKHILVVIDACFSGTFDPDWFNRKKDFRRPAELDEGQMLMNEHIKYKCRRFITSATEVETPDNSKFTKKILEGLRTFSGSGGTLSSDALFANYLKFAFPTPYAGEFGADEAGSSFLFIQNNSASNNQNIKNQTFDRDGDGVVDSKDNCPDLKGEVLNGGCPQQDSDGDGVLDQFDNCPNEKGPITNYGCPLGTGASKEAQPSFWLHGNWSGTLQDYFSISAKAYKAILICDWGKKEILIDYPELQCSGKWTIIRYSESSIECREKVDKYCEDGSSVKIEKQDDNTLRITYFLPVKLGENPTTKGIFYKQSASPEMEAVKKKLRSTKF